MQKLRARLPSGSDILIEAEVGGRELVAAGAAFDFEQLTHVLGEVAGLVAGAIDKARPTEAQVEIGLDASLEGGKLTALLVKGVASATLKVTLKWTQKP